jgi:hypothetical protein
MQDWRELAWVGCGGPAERTFAWPSHFRRLRVRYDKRADIHEAFLSLDCALMCWQFLRTVRITGRVTPSFS